MSSSPTLSSSNIESSSSTISLPAAFRISNADRNLWVFDMQGRVLGQVFVPAGTGINSAILAKFGKAGVYMVKVDGALKAFSVAK